MPARIPDNLLIEDIVKVSKKINKTPLVNEYEYHGKYSPITIRKHFGSWKNALSLANLDPVKINIKWTNQQLQNELKRIEKIVNRRPTYKDIKTHGNIHPDTIIRRLNISLAEYHKVIKDDSWNIDNILPDIGWYITGFAEGDGSFIFSKQGSASFRLSQRADNVIPMKLVADIFNVPNSLKQFSNQSRRKKGQRVGDDLKFSITNRHILLQKVIPFFNRFPLKGKKQLEFEVWSEGVIFMCNRDKNMKRHTRLDSNEKKFIADIYQTIYNIRHGYIEDLLST